MNKGFLANTTATKQRSLKRLTGEGIRNVTPKRTKTARKLKKAAENTADADDPDPQEYITDVSSFAEILLN